ncbi:hypothetical protein GGF32_005372 [Allomyces javanicus]|nr:hypothetical protein GGF32_005372 [Allomyces javanicus]
MAASLATSILTFIVSLHLVLRKGARAAWFYASVAITILPCLLSDILFFAVLGESEINPNAWHIARVFAAIAPATVMLALSIKRLEVFSCAGLADWLTDRRIRACLATVLLLFVACAILLSVSYASADVSHPLPENAYRRLLVNVILSVDVMGDYICTVLVFVVVVRIRSADQRAHRRFLFLVLRVVATQFCMFAAITLGFGVLLAEPGLRGETRSAIFERAYIFFAMIQWQFIMDLLDDRQVQEQLSSMVPSRQATSPAVTGAPVTTRPGSKFSTASRAPSAAKSSISRSMPAQALTRVSRIMDDAQVPVGLGSSVSSASEMRSTDPLRVRIFAHAGLADWLTDRRRRACLAAVLLLGTICLTGLAESYVLVEFALLFHETSKFRRTFVATVLAIDALGDCTCSIVVFVTVLRLRGLVLRSQSRQAVAATPKSSLKATRQLLRANHRLKVLVVRIVSAQAGMLVVLTAGIGVFLALPSFFGEVLGSLFERLYVALTVTQWKFVMDLLHDHLVRERVPRLQEASSAPAETPFYAGIMVTNLPCLLIDIFYFVVLAKSEASLLLHDDTSKYRHALLASVLTMDAAQWHFVTNLLQDRKVRECMASLHDLSDVHSGTPPAARRKGAPRFPAKPDLTVRMILNSAAEKRVESLQQEPDELHSRRFALGETRRYQDQVAKWSQDQDAWGTSSK